MVLDYLIDSSAQSWSRNYKTDSCAYSFPFSIVSIGWFDAGEKYYTRRDGYGSKLAIITESGQGRMLWNGQSCILDAGSAVLIDCGTYQEYSTVPDGRWRFYFVHFNSLSESRYESILLERLNPVRLRCPEAVYYKFARLYDENEYGLSAYAMRSNFVSDLLTEIIVSMSLSPESASDYSDTRNDIRELARYIEKNCHLPLTAEDFMSITNLSKHHLIRLFTAQMGMPPYRYLNMCRVSRAKVLLKTTDMPISEISEAVGYSAPALLLRHFKFFNSMSPGTYRREN